MKNRFDILEGVIGKKDEEQKLMKPVKVFNLNEDIRHTIRGLEQKYILVPDSSKEIHLIHFLQKMMSKENGVRSCIVFASTIEK
jgi:superfamily II DNA/RNA helicase